MTTTFSLGLKLGPSVTREHIEATRNFVDFYELYAQVGCEYELLEDFEKPIVLHIPHSSDGTNFADPKKLEINERTLKHVLWLAEKFTVQKLIFHPELYADEDCTIDTLLSFLRSHYDERLHVENMPYNCLGVRHMGATAAEVAEIKSRGNVKFCLDLAHASEYLEKTSQPVENISDFLALRPNHFHVTDTNLQAVHDPNYDEEHVNFGEGTLEVARLVKLVPEGSQLTLETPMHAEKNIAELTYIRGLFGNEN